MHLSAGIRSRVDWTIRHGKYSQVKHVDMNSEGNEFIYQCPNSRRYNSRRLAMQAAVEGYV